jgi:hypothetical protein
MVNTRFQSLVLIAASPFLWCNAVAEGTRGIWWWTSPEHPWGVDQVLGNPTREAEAIGFFKAWKFSKVYCSFSAQTRANPGVIRAWNSKLHAAGITSQLLLSENTWIYPQHRRNLLTVHIKPTLIDFNAAAGPTERYDALHLDIEPHGFPEWVTLTPLERKNLLLMFRDTFQEVRAFLNQNGAAEIPVYADLPVWYDQVPTPVGWDSVAERDAWFQSLGQSLAGMSLMAYERKTAAGIENGVSWELQNFTGETRVALEASVGDGKTWASFESLLGMMQTQEQIQPLRRDLDIHDFIQFRDLPLPVETWRYANFGTISGDGPVTGNLADPDHDDLANLIEYAFAMDPQRSSREGLPSGSLTTISGKDYPTLTFTRPTSATDMDYTVLVSSNAEEWQSVCTCSGADVTTESSAVLVSRSTSEAKETLVIRVANLISLGESLFFKVRVAIP